MPLSLQEIVSQVKSGQTDPRESVETALRKARDSADLNIFTEIFEEPARKQAALLADKVKSKQPTGRLAGAVFAAKDNFLYAGTKTTAAAPFLEDFIAPYSATCLQKLLDEDAILLGKTNLDAFAHGTSTENSCFGPTLNPHDPSLTPGGSSGGSAAAVAAGICPFALGTDTGGSVRLPASFCGLVGFKPTYGLLSRYGIVAMASSTDCVAPLTRSPQDASFLLELLKGRDDLDSTTLDGKEEEGPRKGTAALKVGVIKELTAELDAEVSKSFDGFLDGLSRSGHQVETISLPNIRHALACYYVLVSAEISSNLSRYDGLRYGRKEVGGDWQEVVSRSRRTGFMAENKRRILLGTYVLSQGYYEAYYQKAQKLRTLLCREFARAFEQADFLVSPTSPTTAFALGEKVGDPLQMYLADLMTVAASLAGLPATNLPLKTESLPVGVQIMTPQRTDGWNLKIAEEIFKEL